MEWQTPNPYVIDTRNVHTALPHALHILLAEAVTETSRNGDVFVMTHPIMTVYRRPWERVLFWHERDANPFLHFMEALNFLGGRYALEDFTPYAKQMAAYSDDGKTLPASYGHRWRTYFDHDQLSWAIGRLRANPKDRRTIISMWDPVLDPIKTASGSKDVPCNTNIFLNIRENRLDMMVNCRSNDIFWGAYGANAVHMSFLHEYLARSIGVLQGRYYQNSFNWHAYREFYEEVMNKRRARCPETSLRENIARTIDGPEWIWDPYATGELMVRKEPGRYFPGLPALMDNPTHDLRADYKAWDEQLAIFLDGAINEADGLTDPFLVHVAVPIRDAHAYYRKKEYHLADQIIEQCAALDWRRGCSDWLRRRAEQRAAPKHVEPDSAHP